MSLVGSVRHEAAELRRDGRGRVLAVIAIPWAVLLGTRMVLPVVLPHLQAAYGLSLTAAGLLIAILWLSGAVGQLPSGMFADRFSEARLMAASVLVVAVALVGFVLAPTVAVLFFATIIWGLGHSMYPIARITVLADIYPERLGSALGLTMATGDIGQTILPPVGGALAIVIAWQVGLGFVIPFLALSSIVIWLKIPTKPTPDHGTDTFSRETARDLIAELRRPLILFVAFVLFLFIGVWQAFTAFYPTYLVTEKGLSPAMASVLFGLFFASGALVKPVAGAAYDRIGMRWAFIIVLAGPVAAFLLLPLLDSLPALVLITVLVSTMLGSGAISQSFIADQFAPAIRGTGLGAVRTTTAVLGASGPLVFGWLGDHGYFDQGYLALGVILGVVILLLFWMPYTPDPPGRST